MSDDLIESWKRIADKCLLGEGPFQDACNQMDENNLTFSVRLITPSEDHDLRSWIPKLTSFLAEYRFDVQIEDGDCMSSITNQNLLTVDLLIFIPLSSNIECFCLEWARIQSRAVGMVICVPEGDSEKYYCRKIREAYGVKTIMLPVKRIVNGHSCKFGVELLRTCADYMMRKVSSSIRELRLKNTIIVLIPGISTRGLWQGEVKLKLCENGLVAFPTNYGKFDVLRFLLPFNGIRQEPIRKVERDVRDYQQRFPDADFCILAHSFGTFITGALLANPRNKFGRIALCGSVLPFDFNFASAENRFSQIVNEVGCRDIWPVVASMIGWNYSPTGSFGFNRGGHIVDRYHGQYGHSSFLNAQFCEKYWIPYFSDGYLNHSTDTKIPFSQVVSILDMIPKSLAKFIFWGCLLAIFAYIVVFIVDVGCWGVQLLIE